MKASELRIGNYINNEQRTEVVVSIDDWKIECHLLTDREKETLYEVSMSLINPIPITQEWLVKFGFDNLGTFGFGIGKFHIRYGKTARDFYFFIDNEFVHIKHVHQLQNLYFALTGEELITNKI